MINEHGFYVVTVTVIADKRAYGNGTVGYGLRLSNGRRVMEGFPRKYPVVFETAAEARAYAVQRSMTVVEG
jgi:hypothetical protein